jgi:prolyl-tRNA synthetase
LVGPYVPDAGDLVWLDFDPQAGLCNAGRSSLFPLCARPRQTPKWPATSFLLRAGYIRQLGAGIYNYLFLGQRSLNKIIAIVREEMDRSARSSTCRPFCPRAVGGERPLDNGMGDNMFRLKDRKGADLCLGMTHEEIMTTIARGELRSYKQLPQIWYQIQTKFRDEPRPKSGLLRVRQFIMKDSYSFDIDKAGLDKSFDLHDRVYRKPSSRAAGSNSSPSRPIPARWAARSRRSSWSTPMPAKI